MFEAARLGKGWAGVGGGWKGGQMAGGREELRQRHSFRHGYALL